MSSLPPHLAERARTIGQRPFNEAGEFVVYWMRTAARGHENPALDVALTLANARGLPVLVYHALSERNPYASDRHHSFVLEGARDVERELSARGIPYAFHLERAGQRRPYLALLAARALVVVTEDFPVAPLREWTERLAERASVLAVDTACVVPMQLVGRAYERAFAFERATQKLREARVQAAWTDVEPERPMQRPELPFEPVALQGADLAACVSACDIDHGVGKVAATPGGSVAGYARFGEFVSRALGNYARDRNDPLRFGVSRLSPYLHYGHVSPLRVAREVAALPGAGPAKYLNELLVWRELAYAFTRFAPSYDDLRALPEWAKATLAEHAVDARPAQFSWETLARGRTGDALWDAAQAHLLQRGELHNNMRMTWGKALLPWTRDPAEALALLIDLNHRYALDGRDPASYGGILWCLGQFDRPFPPERAVYGKVRARPTGEQAQRIDVPAYRAAARGRTTRLREVAVVGAGLAGSMCARTLADHGLTVTVFDEGRSVGGRATSRREPGERTFDHGAQFFTARGTWLSRHVESWERDGVVSRWSPRVVSAEPNHRKPGEAWWVGTPSMGALAQHLACDVDVRLGQAVTELIRSSRGWRLRVGSGTAEAQVFHEADALVIALPAARCAPLLAPVSQLARGVSEVNQAPCWAVMLGVRGIEHVAADVLESRSGPIAWAARESSKPGRRSSPEEELWTLHASEEWSLAHLEDTPESVSAALSEAFLARHAASATVTQQKAHRWRFARGRTNSENGGSLFDEQAALAVCADWLVSARVEGALRSGLAAAGRMLSLCAQ